jgi:hypothetical protein
MNSNRLFKWVHRTSYIYLVVPFIIFCLGWLNIFVGLLVAACVIWATYLVVKTTSSVEFSASDPRIRTIVMIAFLLGLWVLLSGIGGYMFQNWDHHWRNAVFRDLITYEWPVIYPNLDGSGSPITMLTYYIGFWLPAAVVGKVIGWEAANASLFLWSWLGLFCVGILLQFRFKSRSIAPIIFLILFSGIDFIGMLIRQRIAPLPYFSFWPPIYRLENWTTLIQFSSNTTQLFWIFNQAIPTWLCIGLLITTKNKKHLFFLWSLCVFYAPMQAIGILPFMLLEVIKNASKNRWENLISTLKQYLNPANILGGGSILLISYFYFAQSVVSSAGEATTFNVVLFSIFLILEGGLLWLLVYPGERDYQWLVIGAILLVAIFLHNDTFDFGEKISSAALFMLMVAIGDFIFQMRKSAVYFAVVIMLILGSITPLYEISRSIIKTTEYYASSTEPNTRWNNDVSATYPILSDELSMEEVLFHPHSLVADDIKTIQTPTEAKWTNNYLGNATNSVFYQYLARRK